MREKMKFIVFNLVTFLFLAVFIEFLLYVGLRKPTLIPSFLMKAYKYYYQTADRSIIQVDDCGQYDSALFYILKPGVCTFTNREFSVTNVVNSAGLRDDEESLRYPEIIVLGDSYALGWGIPQEQTFPQLVEKFTGQRLLNAGMSSYGTAREVKLLGRLNTDSVKSIIFQYHSNDYEENITAQEHNYELPIQSREVYDKLKKYIDHRQRYFPFKNLYGVCKGFAKTLAVKPDTSYTEADEAKLFLEILRHSDIKTDGIQFFVFKADSYRNINDDFADALDSLLKLPDYTLFNMKTIRLSNTLSKEDYFILDEHMNASGHKKVALEIYEHLKNKNVEFVSREP